MRISQHFNLNKSQAELDFVDINTSRDTALFIDPFFLSKRKDRWSLDATRTVRNFFQTVIDLIRDNDEVQARALFRNLGEDNSNCLGLSTGRPRGRGVGRTDTDKIFDSIIHSRAIQTGLITDLEDNHLFVENFGKDKLSDMTTNIIKEHLINYTISQCRLHGIPLTNDVPSGFYWNRAAREWESQYMSMLIINGKKILLVPKGIVSFSEEYTPYQFYQHFVLNFLQNENLRINSALVQRRNDGTRYVTKKDIKENDPYSKEFLRRFTQQHPGVLRNFKNRTQVSSLSNESISDSINIENIAGLLINQLGRIRAGNNDAGRYHKLIIGVLELIFYPHLIYPILENEIHDGRKRIDITFDNAAETGIFFRLSNAMRLPCQYIFVECKNYSSDPANPELDQLAGRFSPNRGRVGFLLCRTIDNLPLFINRCRDTYRDDRGLVIPLIDSDIIQLLTYIRNLNLDLVDEFLSERIRAIAID